MSIKFLITMMFYYGLAFGFIIAGGAEYLVLSCFVLGAIAGIAGQAVEELKPND